MKALTIRQPWASLIAEGVKTIETRSWSTSYRGRIAIHAGAKSYGVNSPMADLVRSWPLDVYRTLGGERAESCVLPLGAVVATAVLTDCVPMVTVAESEHHPGPWMTVSDRGLSLWLGGEHVAERRDDQAPFGDFAPGRWAWLLDDVQPTRDRCPACWRPAHCVVCDDSGSVPVPGGGKACDGCFRPSPRECRVCDDYGIAEPVPARGRQGLWTWEQTP